MSFKLNTNTVLILAALSMPSAWAADSAVLIKDVHYWSAGMQQLSGSVDILVEDNIIKTIDKNIVAKGSMTVINGHGKSIIPGLIDTHVHTMDSMSPAEMKETDLYYLSFIGAENANAIIMNGVTTIRDAAGPSLGLKRAIDEGKVVGPRVYPSGAAISQTGGHGDFRTADNPNVAKGGYVDETERMGLAYIADGKAEVLAGARSQLRKGATQIKMLVSGAVSGLHDPMDVQEFNYDEIKAAVDVAKNWDTYVMVHAYNDRSIATSLKAGVKSIEHANLITEPTMKLLAESGAFLSAQTYVYTFDMPYFTADQREKRLEGYNGLDNMFKLAKKYGVKITHSTDLYGDPAQFANAPKEFMLRQKWFTPVEILEQATINGAQLVALSGKRNPYHEADLGVIKEGAYADMLLVDGDPTVDIGLLAKPSENLLLIMKDGEVVKNTTK